MTVVSFCFLLQVECFTPIQYRTWRSREYAVAHSMLTCCVMFLVPTVIFMQYAYHGWISEQFYG